MRKDNTMNKMDIYEASRAVPTEAQKQFNNGSFSGTDINPMWRIKKLTELFGPCGIGWYYDPLSLRSETYGNNVMAIVDLNLYVKENGEWSKPIFGTGANTIVKETKNGTKFSDEGYKMALTDALSVAAKALGIGADIYFGADKTKYSANTPDFEKPVDGKTYVCSDCKKYIEPVTKRDGTEWKSSEMAKYSEKRYGRPLCASCMKAAEKNE